MCRNRLLRSICVFLALMMVLCSVACERKDKKDPVTVTLWHIYGGQTESPLNNLVSEFNATVGREKNISVQVESISNTNTIHESILASAFEEPGAAGLPDMFSSYPKTILAMPDENVVVDYRDYLTEEEVEAYIPGFIDEGEVHDRLVVLPVAKSTEIMFVNKTAFDRFAEGTGVDISELSTWESLFEVSEKYREWTDAKTPDVVGDGKNFFVHDYHFNYFQVGVESLGEHFFSGTQVAFGPMFKKAWEPYARAALQGGLWLQGGYATEPLRTGDAIVSVASSASILYYSDMVTYSNNTSEEIEFIALPCPVFREGENLVMQRGAGICTVKSTPEKEEACMVFLKWLTGAEKNTEFALSGGYMPVKTEAFEKHLPKAIDDLREEKYRSLYKAYMDTQKEYRFYTAPQMDNYLALEIKFEELARQTLLAERNARIPQNEVSEEDIGQVLEKFKAAYE